MNLIFVHRPCGGEIGYPSREPVERGLTCLICDPEFEHPGSYDWRQVMADDPDAEEIARRWT